MLKRSPNDEDAESNRLAWHRPRVGDMIIPPAAKAPLLAPVKRARQRKRKRKNVADHRARRRKGIVTLHIVTYDLRAETFARRRCGLKTHGRGPTMEEIAQAISDLVNKEGA
jgi:hypothetical protein